VKARGFSLLECLIGLALSLFIICAALGFFLSAEKRFFRMKEAQEASQSALAALDKMRIDVLRAGEGLTLPVSLGLLEAVTEVPDGIVLLRAEETFGLAEDIPQGETRIRLLSTAGLKSGREICIVDGEKGEVRDVSAVEEDAAVFAMPLDSGYSAAGTAVLLLERTSLTLDVARAVLRRGVNLSPAQPLLENARAAVFHFDPSANIVRIRFGLDSPSQGDKTYELCLFPKNPALAGHG
jgi:prepilin-type N-terminal cleavage/methylation domain-containing protein